MPENKKNTKVECRNIAHLNATKILMCRNIAHLRNESGQTQKEVAEWCGLSLRTYIKLEKGNCTIENLCIVADKFSINIDLTQKKV